MNFARPSVFWIALLIAFVAIIVLLRGVLLPFAAALVLAYLLDPLATWAERALPNPCGVLRRGVVFDRIEAWCADRFCSRRDRVHPLCWLAVGPGGFDLHRNRSVLAKLDLDLPRTRRLFYRAIAGGLFAGTLLGESARAS